MVTSRVVNYHVFKGMNLFGRVTHVSKIYQTSLQMMTEIRFKPLLAGVLPDVIRDGLVMLYPKRPIRSRDPKRESIESHD